jgi:hypothetical protein
MWRTPQSKGRKPQAVEELDNALLTVQAKSDSPIYTAKKAESQSTGMREGRKFPTMIAKPHQTIQLKLVLTSKQAETGKACLVKTAIDINRQSWHRSPH